MKALLFGPLHTLCDISGLYLQCINDAFDEHELNCRWTPNHYRELLVACGGENPLHHPHGEPLTRLLDASATNAISLTVARRLNARLRQGGGQLRSGVQRLVRAARQADLKVGLVTTTSRDTLEAFESYLGGTLPLFDLDIVIDRGVAVNPKPNPECYQIALMGLSCTPEEVVAIEDTTVSIDAALVTGIATLSTPHEFAINQNFCDALACVSHLGDPGNPAKVLGGADALDDGMVTLNSLSRLLQSTDRSVTDDRTRQAQSSSDQRSPRPKAGEQEDWQEPAADMSDDG